MTEERRHLLWGIVLFCLYTVIASLVTPLMRAAAPLAPSQTYALIFVGEIVSFAPYLGIARRKWSIKRKAEWITFIVFGVILATTFLYGIYCAQHMPLGTGNIDTKRNEE